MGQNLLSGFINTFNGEDFEYESIFTEKLDNTNSGAATEAELNSFSYLNNATEAGKAFANKDEAAFGHNFFFITVVFSVTILLIGLISYILFYLG